MNKTTHKPPCIGPQIPRSEIQTAIPTAEERDGRGLVKVKIDQEVFRILRRKKRAGETIRMALERAIMTL